MDVRAGNVRLSGGGSYFRIEERSGLLQVGANNGIATNAYVDIGTNVGNPQGFSVLDLNGFNQQLAGIVNYGDDGCYFRSEFINHITIHPHPGPGGSKRHYGGSIEFANIELAIYQRNDRYRNECGHLRYKSRGSAQYCRQWCCQWGAIHHYARQFLSRYDDAYQRHFGD